MSLRYLSRAKRFRASNVGLAIKSIERRQAKMKLYKYEFKDAKKLYQPAEYEECFDCDEEKEINVEEDQVIDQSKLNLDNLQHW